MRSSGSKIIIYLKSIENEIIKIFKNVLGYCYCLNKSNLKNQIIHETNTLNCCFLKVCFLSKQHFHAQEQHVYLLVRVVFFSSCESLFRMIFTYVKTCFYVCSLPLKLLNLATISILSTQQLILIPILLNQNCSIKKII